MGSINANVLSFRGVAPLLATQNGQQFSPSLDPWFWGALFVASALDNRYTEGRTAMTMRVLKARLTCSDAVWEAAAETCRRGYGTEWG